MAIYFDCTKYHHLRWNAFLKQIVNELYGKYSIGSEETPVGVFPETFKLEETDERYSEDRAALSFESDLKLLYQNLKNAEYCLFLMKLSRSVMEHHHQITGRRVMTHLNTLKKC